MAKHLKKDQKIIVLVKKGEISNFFIHEKIEIHEIPKFPIFDRLFTYILFYIKLIVFKKMVIVSDFMPIPLLALSKHLHFQLIHDIRNFTEFKRVDLFSIGKIIQKIEWGKCQNILTVSNFTKNELIQRCEIKPRKIFVSPNGIEKSYFDIKSNCDNIDIDILCVGTLEPRKNYEVLIKALLDYNGEKTIKVCFIGEDLGSKIKIESLIELLDNNVLVNFVEYVDSEKGIIEYYDRSNIFVIPSLYEGFGMPLIESLSRGCKVLCSDIEVFREVGGDHVEYFPPDDPSALMNLILNNIKNRNRKIVDSKFFESYKWSNIARDLVSYFNKYKLQ